MSDVEKWCPEPLWQVARLLIPPHPKHHQGGGRYRADDRAVLAAILYLLANGCTWAAIPASFGVCKSAAHRRFTEWTEGGLFTRLHHGMLDLLGLAARIDWTRGVADSMSVRALKRGT